MTPKNDYARLVELVERLEAPGRPGEALSASEFAELCSGIREILDLLEGRKLREPCCSEFDRAVKELIFTRSAKLRRWIPTGADDFKPPILVCPWCGAPRAPTGGR